MTLVLTAFWRAKEGQEETIAEIIRTMTPLSRAEAGCHEYIGHRSTEDPRLFMLYEVYADQTALDAHRASAHFGEHVLGRAIPLLEHREAKFYEPLAD